LGFINFPTSERFVNFLAMKYEDARLLLFVVRHQPLETKPLFAVGLQVHLSTGAPKIYFGDIERVIPFL